MYVKNRKASQFRIRPETQFRNSSGGGRRGISLIEILVVVSIIGVLLAIVVPAVQASREAARNMECRNNLRQVGLACQTFHETYGYFPRNTIRPRGVTTVDSQPPDNPWTWPSGSFESWCRQIMPQLEQPMARAQDPILPLGCPADPRGPDYIVPDFGFTWYVGVFSNRGTEGNGVITDDSELPEKVTVSAFQVRDGLSNTILLGERAPAADGQAGWWDSRCCLEDTITAVLGDNYSYSMWRSYRCPSPAYYGPASTRNNCTFNSLSSFHPVGGNFCMADGSVRTINYSVNKTNCGPVTLLEALASRAGGEVVPKD
jgi:prepilin-type N-terminal cleavage/methylation domain-containing protein/prepilin-type processing-associated H-X9-DG protein